MRRGSLIVLALVALGVQSAAADQTPAQQRCLRALYARTGGVLAAAHQAALRCAKRLARGATCAAVADRRLARRTAKLVAVDTARCAADGTRPDFGRQAGMTMAAGAAAEGATLAATLLGTGLAAVVRSADDRAGARCQLALLKRTGVLLDRLWREARRGAAAGLDGSVRTWGPNPTGPLDDATELEAEMRAGLTADRKGRIAKAAAKLLRDAERRCGVLTMPAGGLVPGCAEAASPADLAACAERIARRTVFATMASALGLDVSCDLTDDGDPNDSCIPPALAQHILGRLGYDPDPWSLARLQALGVRGYIEEQLRPAGIADAPALEAALAALPSLTMSFLELRATYRPNPEAGELPLNAVLQELQAAKVLRAILSRRQLEQVLTDFWFNHFNVGVTGRRQKWDVSPYERIAIRPHVLGRFRDLLLAVARSPAMGDYLDNRRNRAGDLNENYGREFLELHTLGVDGGYTETDVVEVARCFTGWREDYAQPDGFRFQADWHDQGSKSLLDGALSIPPNGGERDGIDVVDFVATHPAAARFLARKLIVRFVSETPPPGLLEAAAATYLATGGDLRATLRTILLSPEFLEWPSVREAKVKRPFHLLTSLARATGTAVSPALVRQIVRRSRDLGEELYLAGPPTGYPDVSGFWSSPGAMIVRFNELERAARRGRSFDFAYPPSGPGSAEVVDTLLARFFPGPVSADTRDVAVAFLDVLADPDPTVRAEQAFAVLLSSPEFLLH